MLVEELQEKKGGGGKRGEACSLSHYKFSYAKEQLHLQSLSLEIRVAIHPVPLVILFRYDYSTGTLDAEERKRRVSAAVQCTRANEGRAGMMRIYSFFCSVSQLSLPERECKRIRVAVKSRR